MANQDIMARSGFSWWRIVGWGMAAALLLLPLIAMQITNEVDWSLSDFVIMGILLGSIGLMFEFIVRKSNHVAYRAGATIALVTTFLLIWVNLAVGFIGSEDNPANLMYLGVLLVGMSGAFVARFEAAGMARALASAAVVHAAIGVLAFTSGMGATEPPGPIKLFVLNAVWVASWSFSSWLFRRAAAETDHA